MRNNLHFEQSSMRNDRAVDAADREVLGEIRRLPVQQPEMILQKLSTIML
jgi:hypothetical protein